MKQQPEFDNRLDGPVHAWFQLSYASYLVLPRSLMQAMPVEWQTRMVACLNEMREATRPLEVDDNYIVSLRGKNGRIMKDPYSQYRHPAITRLPVEVPDGKA